MFSNLSTTKFGRFSFEIRDLDLSVVNGLRRTIMTCMPIIAFDADHVTITNNNGPLNNEIIAHRISMIPLCLTDEENDGPDGQIYTLSVINNDPEMLNVTTADFKSELGVAHVKRVFPPHPISKQHILITRLRQNEELELTATTVRGISTTDAGFYPASLCTFSNIIDEDAVAEKLKKGPVGILERERTYLKNEFGDPIAFRFELESECGLSPQSLFKRAINILLDRVQTVHELLNTTSDGLIVTTGGGKTRGKAVKDETEKGADEHITVVKAVDAVDESKDMMKDITRDEEAVTLALDQDPNYPNRFLLTIKNEDDTIGNLFQSIMHNYYIRDKHNNDVTYVGYFAPHPLQKTIVIAIQFDKDVEATIVTAKTEFAESCIRVKDILTEVVSNWSATATVTDKDKVDKVDKVDK